MEAQKDCLVRAISKDGFVNAVAALASLSTFA